MQSIYWVDRTYMQKHKSENPDTLRAMYYPNLVMYPTKGGSGSSAPKAEALLAFFNRYAKRVGILVGVYIISCLPYIGRYVLPAASYYTFSKHVGSMPATVIFCVGLVLPKAYLVRFMHTYFASRSLMRELVSFSSLFPQLYAPSPDQFPASTLLSPRQIHSRTKATLVQRPRGRAFWLCVRLHHDPKDSVHWRPHVWCC